MAKIRHIAIKVEDQEKAANFYKQTFGMTEAWRGPVRDDGNRAIYLTDGYINMAVLPARGGREGIDHFGFQVEDMDSTLKNAEVSGAQKRSGRKTQRRPLRRDGCARSGGAAGRRHGAWVEVVSKKLKMDNGKLRMVLVRLVRVDNNCQLSAFTGDSRRRADQGFDRPWGDQ